MAGNVPTGIDWPEAGYATESSRVLQAACGKESIRQLDVYGIERSSSWLGPKVELIGSFNSRMAVMSWADTIRISQFARSNLSTSGTQKTVVTSPRPSCIDLLPASVDRNAGSAKSISDDLHF